MDVRKANCRVETLLREEERLSDLLAGRELIKRVIIKLKTRSPKKSSAKMARKREHDVAWIAN
jgi:hypothetical protein